MNNGPRSARDTLFPGPSSEAECLQVISAGRTKDLAAWHPERLADVLEGRTPARRGPRSPSFLVDPERLGAVVLWTRRPDRLVETPALSGVLRRLRDRGVLTVLQLTVTGLAGSPLEPGIPGPDETAGALERVLDADLLAGPDCVKMRWDPVADYLLGELVAGEDRGRQLLLSNADAGLFRAVSGPFLGLGALRWVSSALDLKYRGAVERLRRAGIRVLPREGNSWEAFFREVEGIVRQAGGRFSICCFPPLDPWVDREGCIDGKWLNALRTAHFGPGAAPIDERPHNTVRRGGQRPRCRCSFSLDISYSSGFRTCGAQVAEGLQGGCCLYCYSWHGPARGEAASRPAEMIRRLLQDPCAAAGNRPWRRSLRLVAGDGIDGDNGGNTGGAGQPGQ